MGAWGPGLYSDDTTCEVRDFYVELLTLGKSDSEATKEIFSRYQDVLTNREVECLVLLALADTKWNYGRLDNKTKSRAISIICQGGDIEIWKSESPKDVKKREKVLAKLLEKITSPQPELRTIKKKKVRPPKVIFDGPVGEIFSVDLTNGNIALLKVIGFFHDEYTINDPIFQFINWHGTTLPDYKQLEKLSKKTLPLWESSEFCLISDDGRKNPMSFINDTKIAVQEIEVFRRESYTFLPVDRLPEYIQEAINNDKP